MHQSSPMTLPSVYMIRDYDVFILHVYFLVEISRDCEKPAEIGSGEQMGGLVHHCDKLAVYDIGQEEFSHEEGNRPAKQENTSFKGESS